jgi:AAA15 family ATPase/GTPase
VENNHLTYFKVENFKKFDSLEVNDIGQFNLIVGDNNSGKTCLLEALLFDEDGQQLLDNFHQSLTKRGLKFEPIKIPYEINGKIIFDFEFPQGNYFKFLRKNESGKINFIFNTHLKDKGLISVSLVSVGGDKQLIESPELKIPFTNHVVLINEKSFNVYNYDEKILNFPLISFNDSPLEEESIKIYEKLKKREKQILMDILKVVDRNIVDIEFRKEFEDLKNVFVINFEDKDEFVLLNFLGDGFKRIFYIALKALSLQGKRLLIDEIEIGIHHTKQQEFIKNLLLICKELDIQLFMTTHSEECAEAYAEALKELQIEEKGKLIILKKQNGVTKSYTLNIEELETGINNGFSIRG